MVPMEEAAGGAEMEAGAEEEEKEERAEEEDPRMAPMAPQLPRLRQQASWMKCQRYKRTTAKSFESSSTRWNSSRR